MSASVELERGSRLCRRSGRWPALRERARGLLCWLRNCAVAVAACRLSLQRQREQPAAAPLLCSAALLEGEGGQGEELAEAGTLAEALAQRALAQQ